MAFTIKALPPGSHTNAALAENELDAELFNEYEALFTGFDDSIIAIISFVKSLASAIQFIDNVVDELTGPSGTPISTKIGVTTGSGELIPFAITGATSATVQILTDTGGVAEINGGVIPVLVPFTSGQGTFLVNSASPSVVVIEIQSPHASGLDISDTVEITFV